MATTRTKKAVQPAQEEETVKVIRPNELAEQLGIDGKRVRAFLRTEFARPADVKNTNWELTPEMVEAIKERFTPKTEEA